MDWEKFNQYVGVPGLLAVALTLAAIGWVSVKIAIPAEAWGLLGVSWGFYFRGQGINAVNAATSRLGK